jgi:hypothetical protein
MPAEARILCIGKDEVLLRTRCAVLRRNGYEARQSLYPETEELLRTEQFDLIVVSFFLSDEEKTHIRKLTAGMVPAIMLQGLTLAPELLSLVEQHLTPRPGA